MKKLAALVATLTLATGFSVAYGASLPVEGAWGMTMNQNGFILDVTMVLRNQTITTTNKCTFQGQSATVSVTVPAAYDASTITVQGSADQEVSQNGVNCNVSVHPDRMNYVISGANLILSHEGSSDQFALQRR